DGHPHRQVRRGGLLPEPERGGPPAAPRLPCVPRLRRLEGTARNRGARVVRADRDGHADARRSLVGATGAAPPPPTAAPSRAQRSWDDRSVSDAPAAIEVTALRKRYGDYEALRGIDISVSRGEVFGLLGPNGAG